MAEWLSQTKIKIKQISGNIYIPTWYIHAQCSKCNHCFLMIHTEQYKFCPNCAASMKGRVE